MSIHTVRESHVNSEFDEFYESRLPIFITSCEDHDCFEPDGNYYVAFRSDINNLDEAIERNNVRNNVKTSH